MQLSRETALEITVSFAAVAVFVAVIVGIGLTYGGSAGFSSQGAVALIGAIAAFVVLMSAVGYFLAGR